MSATSTDEFDPSERARIRDTVHLVNGNGRPGLSARVTRIEWIGYAILLLLTAIFADRIRIVVSHPSVLQQTQHPEGR